MPTATATAGAAASADVDADALDGALAILRERDGLDLSGYRRSTLGLEGR